MRVLLSFLCILFSFGPALAVETIESLIEDDRVRMSLAFDGEEPFVPGQRVSLQVRVATQTWMTGGTRIGHIDVPDALVGQQKPFATNKSYQEGGVNWTGQIWDIDIYPTKAGLLTVPPFDITLSVADQDGKPVKGRIRTEAISSVVEVPQKLRLDKDWVVTSQLELKQGMKRKPGPVKAGDAIILTYVTRAQNVPVTLLPEVGLVPLEGLAIYPGQPKLTEKTNRGVTVSERIDTITLIAERDGGWTIPTQEVVWWQPEKKVRKILTFKAVHLGRGAEGLLSADELSLVIFPLMLGGAVLFELLLFVAVRRRGSERKTRFDEKAWRKSVMKAWKEGRLLEAIGLLYTGRDKMAGRITLLNDHSVLKAGFKENEPQPLPSHVFEKAQEKPEPRETLGLY